MSGTTGERKDVKNQRESGRAWLEIDADNKAKAFIYNSAGQLAWVVTDVNPATTALPTPLPTIRAGWESWAGGAGATATQYQYNELCQQTAQIDGNGHTTSLEYDALARQKK